jgi:pimeloyl-ACP methyl ester carboxylesterase
VRLRVSTTNGTPLYAEAESPTRATATVVLCHDWLADLHSWDAPWALLAGTDVRLVRYDLRGHGRSAWSPLAPGQVGVGQLGQDLAGVVAAAAPSGPIILAAHGVGAVSVMAYAALHPEIVQRRVAGVLFCAATAGPFRPDRHQLKVARQRPKIVVRSYLATMRAHDSRITVPALRQTRVAVVAPEQDRTVPFAQQVELARLVDGARLLSVPETGHDVLSEAPEVVSSELLGLVETVAGRGTMPKQRRPSFGVTFVRPPIGG